MKIKPLTKKDIKKFDRDKAAATADEEEEAEEVACYRGLVWVFSNISGMLSFSPDGTIRTCNRNFSLMLFGYSEQELVGQVRHTGLSRPFLSLGEGRAATSRPHFLARHRLFEMVLTGFTSPMLEQN